MFFSEMELAESAEPSCAKCGLKDTCDRFQVRHRVTGDVLCLFPNPSVDTEFTGKLAGLPQYISQGLIGKCNIAYSVACHSPSVTEKQMEYCSPFLLSTIEEMKPRIIYAFGPLALNSVIRFFWKKGIGPYPRWIGENIPIHFRDFSCHVVPMFDPKEYEKKTTANTAFALSKDFLIDKPRPKVSKSKVWILYETDLILQALSAYKRSESPVAFDYETTGLKPDTGQHRVLCVALCNGADRATAFQISEGKIRDVFVSFLKSPVPKIAANLKFEERWSRKIFKTPVRNWVFDSMLHAHCRNANHSASGLKFQAFVKLGLLPYDEEVEGFITAKNPNEKNNLEAMDKHKLLQYCGMDAWAEWQLYNHAKGA